MKIVNFKTLSFIIATLLLICIKASAQVFLEEDRTGRPIKAKQYEDIDGTPYFYDDWLKGTIKNSKGDEYKDIELKYDIVAGTLLFKGKNGQALEFINPVIEFSLLNLPDRKEEVLLFRNGYPEIGENDKNTFYQVLTEGEITLLKSNRKVVREEKAYNSATIKKKIVPLEEYYFASSTKIGRVKLNEKAILNLLNDQSDNVKDFIDKNKLKLKDERSLIKLINYYNSL